MSIIFILPLFLGCSSSKKIDTNDTISLRSPEEIYASEMIWLKTKIFYHEKEDFKVTYKENQVLIFNLKRKSFQILNEAN